MNIDKNKIIIFTYSKYPSVLYYQWGISISYSGSGLYAYQTPSDYYVKGSTFTNIPFTYSKFPCFEIFPICSP